MVLVKITAITHNTPKTAPNGQISKRSKTIFGDCVKKKEPEQGNLLRPTPSFFFLICQSAYAPLLYAGAQLNRDL
jgi:hypothetical protein